jgi:hypothetical protein
MSLSKNPDSKHGLLLSVCWSFRISNIVETFDFVQIDVEDYEIVVLLYL